MKKFLVVTLAALAVLSLGLVQIHCGGGGNNYECTSEDDCAEGFFCDYTVHECKEDPCVANCAGVCCGPDGCGGQCPADCPQAGTSCNQATCLCENDCQPDCSGKECGPDSCGETCGTCSAGHNCVEGVCVCEPICEAQGRICGPDGCNGECQPGCPDGETCAADGLSCVCTPDCTGKICGDDGCNGICPPGCPDGQACAGGQCQAIQPHDGAGQACNCATDPCPIPCPTEAGSAQICLMTDSPNEGDGFCTFECSAEGADGECQVDFTDGCCEPTSTAGTFVCYTLDYCPGGQGYLDRCDEGQGNCAEEFTCVGGFGANEDESYCFYPCTPPDGACQDGGECFETTVAGNGFCLPPGDGVQGDFCNVGMLQLCEADLICVTVEAGATTGYCSALCEPCPPQDTPCAGADSPSCFLSGGDPVFCACGYWCTTATDCPDGGTGWKCQDFCMPEQ